jgi:DNA helicase-2/ATP-dependent DNA helicase PcrA
MPYKIYGGLSFYQRKEVKDLIAYFRLVVNPNDSEALKRVINYPARGIGATTLGKIEETAARYNLSMWSVVVNPGAFSLDVNKGTLNKLQGFKELIEKFQALQESNDAYDLARLVASDTGVMKELYNGNTLEERTKYENVEELLNGIRDFVAGNYQEGNPARLENFLENVALLTDQDTEKGDDNNKVTLMTIHAAKGLEFPHVYIVGLEEELFPSAMSVHSQSELEEERRLFYVALTRAEKQVTLSYCKSRYKYGTPVSASPSRFIREIDTSFVKNKSMFKGRSQNSEPDDTISETRFIERGGAFKKPIRAGMNLAASRKLQQMAKPVNSNFTPDAPEQIKSGMQVEHQQFGAGRVIQIEGEGTNKKALVFFNSFGEKKLLLKFARLRILS